MPGSPIQEAHFRAEGNRGPEQGWSRTKPQGSCPQVPLTPPPPEASLQGAWFSGCTPPHASRQSPRDEWTLYQPPQDRGSEAISSCSRFCNLGGAGQGQPLFAPGWPCAGRGRLPTPESPRGPPSTWLSTTLGSRKPPRGGPGSTRPQQAQSAGTRPPCCLPSVREPRGLSSCEGRSGCGDRGRLRPPLKTEVETALPEGRDNKVTGSSGTVYGGMEWGEAEGLHAVGCRLPPSPHAGAPATMGCLRRSVRWLGVSEARGAGP